MKISPVKNYNTSFESMSSDYSYITDPSGRFYAGMTLEEAQEDGTDSSFWRRDFGNLDKDMDGVLSVEEIFKERNRDIKLHKISAGIFSAFAILDSFVPSSNFGEKMFFIVLDLAFIANDLMNIHNISKGNKRYMRMMESGNDANFSVTA